MNIVGHLRADVGYDAANAELAGLAKRLSMENNDTAAVRDLAQPFVRATIPTRVYSLLYAMLAAVFLVRMGRLPGREPGERRKPPLDLRRGWRVVIDGYYGPKSVEVATKFQREKHLKADGLLGPDTFQAAWTAPITK